MISQKNRGGSQFKLAVFGIIAFVLITLPIFAFSSRRSDLYVNAKASGNQDGSKDHPYEKISQATDKANGKKVDIHVSKGEYKENIALEKGVRLFGEDKDKTIIKAKKDNRAVVYMKKDVEINGFTIKDGKQGIWVEDKGEAKIINCIIKDNDEDGIYIEASDAKESNQVIISENNVRRNGYKGIRAVGARKVSITDNEIYENKNDGIDLARGTSAWIGGNSIKSNGGSGMKLAIDGSNIWTKNNSVRNNKREGAEIASYGGAGRINISKSKFVDNGLYGIARLQRAGNISWGAYLTDDIKTEFWGNGSGSISNVIYIK